MSRTWAAEAVAVSVAVAVAVAAWSWASELAGLLLVELRMARRAIGPRPETGTETETETARLARVESNIFVVIQPV
jgi:hypothetical protein